MGAERRFSQFGGRQYGSSFNNAGGFTPLDPNDRTLTIQVQNTNTSTAQTARVFGSTFDLTDATLNAAVLITVAESSHLRVKTELLASPFRIVGMRYLVTTVGQLSNAFSIINTRSTGGSDTRVIQPNNWRSAQNQVTTQVDMLDFTLLVDKNTYISFTVNASETVTLVVSISEKVDIEEVLKQRNVLKETNVPPPTGLPQLDMYSGQRY